MIEINRNPSPKELRWTGVLFLIFCGILGAVIWWQFGGRTVAFIVWGIGAVAAIVYYAVPFVRRPFYLGWMYLAYPIGWTISHVLMALIFYLLITPIGLLMRIFGRNPMERRFDPAAKSYWVKRDPPADSERYFRQF